jgi:hypothetical protein
MKYILTLLIFILISCSSNSKSPYLSLDNDASSNGSERTFDFKKMTFEKFKIFLLEYSDKVGYPNIND